jgi:archaellum biogenesis ATPase FlaH
MQNLKIINMDDVEREYVSWLMKPYIPFGKITIVQGDPGEGKTTVMLRKINRAEILSMILRIALRRNSLLD